MKRPLGVHNYRGRFERVFLRELQNAMVHSTFIGGVVEHLPREEEMGVKEVGLKWSHGNSFMNGFSLQATIFALQLANGRRI